MDPHSPPSPEKKSDGEREIRRQLPPDHPSSAATPPPPMPEVPTALATGDTTEFPANQPAGSSPGIESAGLFINTDTDTDTTAGIAGAAVTAGDTTESLVDEKKGSSGRKYQRISSSPSAAVSQLRLAKRVAEVQDAEYGIVLLVTILCTVILWASTYVREAHSTLLPWTSLGTKIFLSALVVACSIVAWVGSRASVRTSVTAGGLRSIPVVAAALSLLLVAYILAKGWWALAILMAMYWFADASQFHKLGEDADFAAVMLQIVDDRLTGSIRTICRAMLVLQVGLLILWSWFFVDLIQCHMVATASFTGMLTLFLTYLLLFWVSGLLRSIVSLVASGVLADQLLRHNSGKVSKTELTTLLLRRSMSTSFGTCCAGSIRLLAAGLMLSFAKIAETCEALLQRALSLRGQRATSRSFNIHRRYEEIFEFATGYCWARAALRGCRFSAASRATWQRINRNGLDFAVFGTYTEYIFQYLASVLAAMFALGAVFVLHFFNRATYSVLFVFAVLGVCTVLAQMVFEPWRAAVSVILVCYSEEPTSLSEPYPVLYHRFLRISEVEAFHKVHQGRSTSTAMMLGKDEEQGGMERENVALTHDTGEGS